MVKPLKGMHNILGLILISTKQMKATQIRKYHDYNLNAPTIHVSKLTPIVMVLRNEAFREVSHESRCSWMSEYLIKCRGGQVKPSAQFHSLYNMKTQQWHTNISGEVELSPATKATRTLIMTVKPPELRGNQLLFSVYYSLCDIFLQQHKWTMISSLPDEWRN